MGLVESQWAKPWPGRGRMSGGNQGYEHKGSFVGQEAFRLLRLWLDLRILRRILEEREVA